MTATEIAGDLTAYAYDLGLAEEDLDEEIYDVEAGQASSAVNDGGDDQLEHRDAETRAAAINNGGLHAQVTHLAEECGAEHTKRLLESIAARKRR